MHPSHFLFLLDLLRLLWSRSFLYLDTYSLGVVLRAISVVPSFSLCLTLLGLSSHVLLIYVLQKYSLALCTDSTIR